MKGSTWMLELRNDRALLKLVIPCGVRGICSNNQRRKEGGAKNDPGAPRPIGGGGGICAALTIYERT